MYDGNSALTKSLIDAYALLGRRMWSVVGPRSEGRRRAPPTMRIEPFEAAVPQERLDDLSRGSGGQPLAGLAGREPWSEGPDRDYLERARHPLALRVRLAPAGGSSQSVTPNSVPTSAGWGCTSSTSAAKDPGRCPS